MQALAVSGTSLMVMSGGHPSPLAWSDRVGARLEDLQQALGEGPCIDAHEWGRPVSEPDLARPTTARWPAFGPAARDAGASSLFSFPLRMGAIRVGALTLHRLTPGELSHDQHADALAVAMVAVSAILVSQAKAPPGSLGPDLEPLIGYGATLHQASGMVSVQLGISVGEALVRLRAHAFACDRLLKDVADDVVARRLRLEG